MQDSQRAVCADDPKLAVVGRTCAQSAFDGCFEYRAVVRMKVLQKQFVSRTKFHRVDTENAVQLL